MAPRDTPPQLVIVSGGQTGADRAALDWARRRGIEHGGWCPRGRLAEDGVIGPEYRLREAGSANPAQRTRRNVEDSDGTVLISVGEPLTGGSLLTVEHARAVGRPHLQLAGEEPGRLGARLAAFVARHAIERLNVAGPRASKEPRVAALVEAVLEAAFPARERVALWLVPAHDDASVLRDAIAHLARRFDAPVFEPHVTLAAGELEPAARDAALSGAASAAPLACDVARFDTTAELSRTLFLSFTDPAPLVALTDRVRTADARLAKSSPPHLSLLYRALDEDARRALVREVAPPLAQVRFDAACTVLLPSPGLAPEDIALWTELARLPLAAGAS